MFRLIFKPSSEIIQTIVTQINKNSSCHDELSYLENLNIRIKPPKKMKEKEKRKMN